MIYNVALITVKTVTRWSLAAASAIILHYPNKSVQQADRRRSISLLETFKWLSIIVVIINIHFSMATEENQRLRVTFSEFYIYLNKWQAKSNPLELVNSFVAF